MTKFKVFLYSMMLLLVTAGAVALWQQETLIAWYRVWKLPQATALQIPTYVRQFEAMGIRGTEALIQVLRKDNAPGCQNAQQVLCRIINVWQKDVSRCSIVAEQLTQYAASFSEAGTEACLPIMAELAQTNVPASTLCPLAASLALRMSDERESREATYQVVLDLAQKVDSLDESLKKQCRSLVLVGLKSRQSAVRLQAIRLAVLPGLQLHEHLVSLVTWPNIDGNPEVRRLAILALGEHEQLLSTDHVCALLNDVDAQVSSIAEKALLVRGLGAAHIKLAKLMHDTNPVERAGLPALVMRSPEIDQYQWMERLSRDSSAAVRAATARALAAHDDQRYAKLLKQLSEQDHDPSVQGIARYYVK